MSTEGFVTEWPAHDNRRVEAAALDAMSKRAGDYALATEQSAHGICSIWLGVGYPTLAGPRSVCCARFRPSQNGIPLDGPPMYFFRNPVQGCTPKFQDSAAACGSCCVQVAQIVTVLCCVIQLLLVFPRFNDGIGLESDLSNQLDSELSSNDSRWYFIAGVWLLLPMIAAASYYTRVLAMPPAIAICAGGVPSAAVLGQFSWAVGRRLSAPPKSPFREFDVCCVLQELTDEEKDEELEHEESSIGSKSQPDLEAGSHTAGRTTIHSSGGSMIAQSVPLTGDGSSNMSPLPPQLPSRSAAKVLPAAAPRSDSMPSSAVSTPGRTSGSSSTRIEGQPNEEQFHRSHSAPISRGEGSEQDRPGARVANSTGLETSGLPPDVAAAIAFRAPPGNNCLCIRLPFDIVQPAAMAARKVRQLPFIASRDVGLRRRVSLVPFLRAVHASLQAQERAEGAIWQDIELLGGHQPDDGADASGQEQKYADRTVDVSSRARQARLRVLDQLRARLRLAFSFLEELTAADVSSLGMLVAFLLVIGTMVPRLVGTAASGLDFASMLVQVLGVAVPACAVAFGATAIYATFEFVQAAANRLRALVFVLSSLQAPDSEHGLGVEGAMHPYDSLSELSDGMLAVIAGRATVAPREVAAQRVGDGQAAPPARMDSSSSTASAVGEARTSSRVKQLISRGMWRRRSSTVSQRGMQIGVGRGDEGGGTIGVSGYVAECAIDVVLERLGEIRQVTDYISNAVGVVLGVTAVFSILLGVSLGVISITLSRSNGVTPALYGLLLECASVLLLILPARASSTLTNCLQDVVRAPEHSMLGWAARRRTGRLTLFSESSEQADAIRLLGVPIRPPLLIQIFSVVGTLAVVLSRFIGSDVDLLM